MIQQFLLISFVIPLMIFWIPQRLKKQKLHAYIIRRTLIVLPYLLWLNIFDWNKVQWSYLKIILFLFVVILLIWWERTEYFFKVSSLHAQLAGKLGTADFFSRFINLSVFVIAEEVFFRLGVLSNFNSNWGVFGQSVAFVVSHYLTPWRDTLTKKDLIRQFIFSMAAGFYFVETNDLFMCILGHALLNFPEFIHLLRRLKLQPLIGEDFNGTF